MKPALKTTRDSICLPIQLGTFATWNMMSNLIEHCQYQVLLCAYGIPSQQCPFLSSSGSISVPIPNLHFYIIQINIMQSSIDTLKRKLQHAASPNRRLKLPPRRRPVAHLPPRHHHRHSDASLRSQSVGISSFEAAGAGAWNRERVVNVDGVICAGAKR